MRVFVNLPQDEESQKEIKAAIIKFCECLDFCQTLVAKIGDETNKSELYLRTKCCYVCYISDTRPGKGIVFSASSYTAAIRKMKKYFQSPDLKIYSEAEVMNEYDRKCEEWDKRMQEER